MADCYGVREIPLSYVIRAEELVEPEAEDPLINNRPYGNKHGSILMEMIHRYSHDHTLFKTDNEKVYKLLVEATQGTQYAPTVTAFSRRKAGRDAWNALLSSHVGRDKWEHMAKEKVNWIRNATWNGKVYPLEKFITKHRNSHVQILECQTKQPEVEVLSDPMLRIRYMIDNITSVDPDLKAGIAQIRTDANGARSNFEEAVNILLPLDPYKPTRKRVRTAEVGSMAAGAGKANSGTGSTGVEFRYYKTSEFKKLTKEQKRELMEYRKRRKAAGNGNGAKVADMSNGTRN